MIANRLSSKNRPQQDHTSNKSTKTKLIKMTLLPKTLVGLTGALIAIACIPLSAQDPETSAFPNRGPTFRAQANWAGPGVVHPTPPDASSKDLNNTSDSDHIVRRMVPFGEEMQPIGTIYQMPNGRLRFSLHATSAETGGSNRGRVSRDSEIPVGEPEIKTGATDRVPESSTLSDRSYDRPLGQATLDGGSREAIPLMSKENFEQEPSLVSDEFQLETGQRFRLERVSSGEEVSPETGPLSNASRGGFGGFLENTPFDTNTWKPSNFGGFTGYKTNKFDLKAGIEQGGWVVAWGSDIREQDAIYGVIAAGVSVKTGNPAAFYAWVDQLAMRTFYSLSASAQSQFPAGLRNSAKKLAAAVIADGIRGRSPRQTIKQFGTVDFKAGVIQYRGGNYALGKLITPTTGFKPFIAFRIRGPAVVSNSSNSSPKIDIDNPNNFPVNYQLNGKQFTIRAGGNVWHSNTDGRFNINFDSSFSTGTQSVQYSLRPGTRNRFVFQNRRIDLQIVR